MSKLLSKWFGGGGKKGKRNLCEEPCCVERRQKETNDDSLSGTNKVENMSAHVESKHISGNGNANGHIKTDQSDGKNFSKTIRSNRCCGRDNISDSSNDSLTGSPSEEGGISNNFSVNELGYYEPRIKNATWMPVSKDASHYNMDHFQRGKALIFNFDTWDNTSVPSLDLKPRLGSIKDRDDLAACLKKLDFDVRIYNNLTSGRFWKVIREARKEDHRENDCLVVAIMTHGEKNHIFVRDGTLIPVNLVWEKFEAHKCPSLAGKPKIFLIQACRGTNYDHGTTLSGSQEVTAEIPRDVTDSSNFSYVIPNAADIIVAFSCPEGHYSWRHPTEGSWFIQAICKVLNQHAYDMDLQGCLTKVAREVALYKESSTSNPAHNKKRQVTATSSTLIRIVQFKPKKPFYITTSPPILVTSTEKALISVGKGGGGGDMIEPVYIDPLYTEPLDAIPPLVAASPNGASFNEVFDSKL